MDEAEAIFQNNGELQDLIKKKEELNNFINETKVKNTVLKIELEMLEY